MLTMFRSRVGRVLLSVAAVVGLGMPVAACTSQPACAATVVARGSYGGSSHYSAPSSSGSRTYGGSSGRTYTAPKSSGSRSTYSRAPSNSGSRVSSGRASSGSSKTFSYSSGGRSYSLPSRITSRSYRGPTGTVFVYHTHSYYRMGGYHNLWNPYDWTNYYNPLSPWYGHSGMINAGAYC